jgi:hypothetical protein
MLWLILAAAGAAVVALPFIGAARLLGHAVDRAHRR